MMKCFYVQSNLGISLSTTKKNVLTSGYFCPLRLGGGATPRWKTLEPRWRFTKRWRRSGRRKRPPRRSRNRQDTKEQFVDERRSSQCQREASSSWRQPGIKKRDSPVLTHCGGTLFSVCLLLFNLLMRGGFLFLFPPGQTLCPPLQVKVAGFFLRVSSNGAPATGGQSRTLSRNNSLSTVTTSVILYTKKIEKKKKQLERFVRFSLFQRSWFSGENHHNCVFIF